MILSLFHDLPMPEALFRACASLLLPASLAMVLTGCQLPAGAAQRALDSGQADTATETTARVRPRAPRVAPESLAAIPNELAELFAMAKVLVSSHESIDLADVQLLLSEDRSIDREVRRETSRLIDAQFHDPAFRSRFVDAVMASQEGRYAALYVDHDRTVRISRTQLAKLLASVESLRHPGLSANRRALRPSEPVMMPDFDAIRASLSAMRQEAQLALLIHELVHAADDARHNIHGKRELTFRASFAESAIYEGHAQWVTRRICEQHGCQNGLTALESFMFAPAPWAGSINESLLALGQDVLAFSYIEGERFIHSLAERPDGTAAIRQALANPPADPIQILTPETFPDTVRKKRNNELLDNAARSAHPFRGSTWYAVQTSPLKGLNLRRDKEQRAAVIDGFSRLITALVALQYYEESAFALRPVDVTLLRANSPATAALFASTLHENALRTSLSARRQRIPVLDPISAVPDHLALYVAREPDFSGEDYLQLTATTGSHVVQIGALGMSEQALVSYALAFLKQAEAITFDVPPDGFEILSRLDTVQ